jgi:hypothetical protein
MTLSLGSYRKKENLGGVMKPKMWVDGNKYAYLVLFKDDLDRWTVKEIDMQKKIESKLSVDMMGTKTWSISAATMEEIQSPHYYADRESAEYVAGEKNK